LVFEKRGERNVSRHISAVKIAAYDLSAVEILFYPREILKKKTWRFLQTETRKTK
jgi:hypothetical protein